MKKLSTEFGHHLLATRTQSPPSSPQKQSQTQETSLSSYTSEQVFEKSGFSLCQILGNFNKAFIVCSHNSNIYLIDQHAASEKSLYVRLLGERNLLPEVYEGEPIQVENIYRQVLEEEEAVLRELGWTYEIVNRGPVFTTVRLCTAPSILARKSGQNQFLQTLQAYFQNSMQQLSKTQKQSLASIACHNAYRIGDTLSRSDMRALVDSLYQMPGAYNCPHNRPVIVMLGMMTNWRKWATGEREYSLL